MFFRLPEDDGKRKLSIHHRADLGSWLFAAGEDSSPIAFSRWAKKKILYVLRVSAVNQH